MVKVSPSSLRKTSKIGVKGDGFWISAIFRFRDILTVGLKSPINAVSLIRAKDHDWKASENGVANWAASHLYGVFEVHKLSASITGAC